MKRFIKLLLKQSNLYYHFKYSYTFRLYEDFFKPKVKAQHRKEVNLYQSFLNSPNMVFDIGAYDGHKTAAFLEISSEVVSCEPDPENFRLLTARFRNCKKRVHLINCAISDKQGEAVLQRNHKGSAFNTLKIEWKNILEKDNVKRWSERIVFKNDIAVKVQTTTLDNLIEQFGTPDFVKIDVEGSELEVIQGLTHKIKSISFECLLPEFEPQLIKILDRLISFDESYRFNVIYNEELLFNELVNHPRISNWIKTTKLYSFDMLAVLKG